MNQGGYITHVNIDQKLQQFVTSLTWITEETLRIFGVSFKDAFKGLSDFIRQEKEINPSPLTLISHGGMRGDFLLLLTNCMKNDVDYGFLTTATFVDSVKAFKDSGYYKPGLDTLCRINNITNVIRHSAKDDASILKQLCETHQFIFERCKTASFNEVLEYVMWKLPRPILTLRITAEYVTI